MAKTILRPVASAILPAASLEQTWSQRFASLLLEERGQPWQLELQLLHQKKLDQNDQLNLQLQLVTQHLQQLLQLLLKPDTSAQHVDCLSQIILETCGVSVIGIGAKPGGSGRSARGIGRPAACSFKAS